MAENYALVFVEDPPSVELFRNDQFSDIDKKKKCLPLVEGSMRLVKRPSWKEPLQGKIILTGNKTKCVSLQKRVTATGEVIGLDEGIEGYTFVGTRFSELAKLKALAALSSREANLARTADGIIESGPDSVIPSTNAVKKVCRLPKQRPQAVLQALQQQLDTLPCWRRQVGDTHLVPGIDVFANESRLLSIIKYHSEQPSMMLKKLMKLLMPPPICENDALSRTGGAHTVAIPEDIISAATGFVELHCPKGADFQLAGLVKGWLYYRQHKADLKLKRLAKQGTQNSSSTPFHRTFRLTQSIALPSTSSLSPPTSGSSSSTSVPPLCVALPSNPSSSSNSPPSTSGSSSSTSAPPSATALLTSSGLVPLSSPSLSQLPSNYSHTSLSFLNTHTTPSGPFSSSFSFPEPASGLISIESMRPAASAVNNLDLNLNTDGASLCALSNLHSMDSMTEMFND